MSSPLDDGALSRLDQVLLRQDLGLDHAVAGRRRAVLILEAGQAAPVGLTAELERAGLFVAGPEAAPATGLPPALGEYAALLVFVPELDGSTMDRLRAAHETDPFLRLVVVAGDRQAEAAMRCLRQGAAAYLPMPVRNEDITATVLATLVQRDELVREARERDWMQRALGDLGAMVARERRETTRHGLAALEALTRLVETRDPHLAGHSLRVADLAGGIAVAMGRSDDDVEAVRLAGRLHDLGIVAIPSQVVAKQGPLTPDEYEMIKRHPTFASGLLAQIAAPASVTAFVRSHHERWDGRGYPDGLAGDRIPWGARVLAAAEVFDALTTSRPYQRSVTAEEALAKMELLAGTAIDPAVYQALVVTVRHRRALPLVSPAGDSRPSATWQVAEVRGTRPSAPVAPPAPAPSPVSPSIRVA